MNTNNDAIKTMILERLAMVEYTHTYAFGIRDMGIVKVAIVDNADEILPLITKCERNAISHGGVYGVRMWNSHTAFNTIKAYAREVIDLCSVKEFERLFKEKKVNGYKGNRGNLFEDMTAELLNGQQMENKSAKCTECGDIIVNGEHIQVKLWNATITTESQVNRFYTEYMKESN